jgi:hypothetical protein
LATIAVPGGTPIKIALTQEIASNSARAGDRILFKAMNNVTSDGWIVIEKGALGEAEVVSAESAGGNGHPGKIDIRFDWIYAADGLKLHLSDVPQASNGQGQQGGASTATVASYLILGPVGLFAHNFVRGKDVVIGTDQTFEAYVEQTVHVVPNARLSDADGFAH